MIEPFTPQPYIISEPTANLRFIERDGKRILQQRWALKHCDIQHRVTGLTGEWRDVPLETETDGE